MICRSVSAMPVWASAPTVSIVCSMPSQHMAQATGSAADDSRYRDLADQLN